MSELLSLTIVLGPQFTFSLHRQAFFLLKSPTHAVQIMLSACKIVLAFRHKRQLGHPSVLLDVFHLLLQTQNLPLQPLALAAAARHYVRSALQRVGQLFSEARAFFLQFLARYV